MLPIRQGEKLRKENYKFQRELTGLKGKNKEKRQQLRKILENEKLQAIQDFQIKKQQEFEAEKEALRDKYIKQRDLELNKVIKKLSEEHVQGKKLLEQQVEQRVKLATQQISYEIEQKNAEVEHYKQMLDNNMQAKYGLNE